MAKTKINTQPIVADNVDHLIGRGNPNEILNNPAISQPFELSDKYFGDEVNKSHATAQSELQATTGKINGFESKAARLKQAREDAAIEGLHPEAKKIHDNTVKTLETELKNDATAAYKEHAAATKSYNAAIKALDNKVKSDLAKLTSANTTYIESVKGAGHLNAEQKASLITKTNEEHLKHVKAVTDAADKKKLALTEHYTESLEKLKEIEGHSGTKIPEANKSGAISSAEKSVGGMWEKAKANFGSEAKTSTKIFRGAGVAVGVGAMIDGLKKIVAPKRNEQGERDGTMFGAVGEAGLGAALTYASAVGFAKGKGLGK